MNILPIVGLGFLGYALWTAFGKKATAAPRLPATTQPPPPARRPPPARGCVGTGQYVTTPSNHRHAEERSLRLELCRSMDQPQMPTRMQLDAAADMAPALKQALLNNLWMGSYHSEFPVMRDGRDVSNTTTNRSLQRMVTEFQTLMNLGADGKYGAATAGALMFVTGNQPPPPPLFVHPRVIMLYQPVGSGVQA